MVPQNISMTPPIVCMLIVAVFSCCINVHATAGQLEARFSRDVSKGTLIPYCGEIGVDSPKQAGSAYAFAFRFGETNLVLHPDLGTAAPYVNDYCGPVCKRICSSNPRA